MRTGIWHQMGDKSQRLVLEQLQGGAGVGVIISPRDLAFPNAIDYAQHYRALGAEVLIDQQFYIPKFTNNKLSSYPLSVYRSSISQLAKLNDNELVEITDSLITINHEINASAIIAPAILYEQGRGDIADLNVRLFRCARRAANQLGIPCYATLFLGRSATSSDNAMLNTLSVATALDADGWYFGFEFPQSQRIPSVYEDVLRCAVAGLTLACTGKPVLHAYAGPMAILSPAFGVTAAGIGHFQNMWQFSPSRWHEPSKQGGGGDAPPRFFSTALWGTIIYPDEITQLPKLLRDQVLTTTPFSDQLRLSNPGIWGRWDANKHLVYAISSKLQQMFEASDPLKAGEVALEILANAIGIHRSIRGLGIVLNDNTDTYQPNWYNILNYLRNERSQDYQYLSALRS